MSRNQKHKPTVLFMLCLLSLYGCQNSEYSELAQAKAEAEAAKAELDQLQAAEQEKNPKCAINGELFVTTQSGDVKKAAGLSVTLIPITNEFRNRLSEYKSKDLILSKMADELVKPWELQNPKPSVSEIERYDKWLATRNKLLEKLDPQRQELNKQREELFSKNAHNTTTNSDGEFQAEVSAGDYILISDAFAVSYDKLAWLKIFKAEGEIITLSLNQESAVLGTRACPETSILVNGLA